MLYLARFALKGVSQAALVAATLPILGLMLVVMTPPALQVMVLTLIVPFTVLVSAAVIALGTLVHGFRQGMLVMTISVVGLAFFAAQLFGVPQLALNIALLVWLPVWIVASTLRQTVSIAASLQVITILSLFGVITFHIMFPEYEAYFGARLDDVWAQFASVADEQQMDVLRLFKERVLLIAPYLPGIFASNVLFTTILSLCIARWWQAALYNPGGFSKEYQSLNLGHRMGVFTVGLCLAAVLMRTDVTYSLLLVISSVYLMQGSAIMHAVFASKQFNAVWLYLVYILMLFIPHLVVLLAFIGLVDTWVDIRRRFVAKI